MKYTNVKKWPLFCAKGECSRVASISGWHISHPGSCIPVAWKSPPRETIWFTRHRKYWQQFFVSFKGWGKFKNIIVLYYYPDFEISQFRAKTKTPKGVVLYFFVSWFFLYRSPHEPGVGRRDGRAAAGVPVPRRERPIQVSHRGPGHSTLWKPPPLFWKSSSLQFDVLFWGFRFVYIQKLFWSNLKGPKMMIMILNKTVEMIIYYNI